MSLYSDPSADKQFYEYDQQERSYQEGYSDMDRGKNSGASKRETNKESSSLLPNSKSAPNIHSTGGPAISKEERTLISMAESSSSSKSSSNTKTEEEDFWELLNDDSAEGKKGSKN